MDLRTRHPTAGQVKRARDLAVRGLINYQPFVFADDLETGVALEFERGDYVGLIHCPNIDPERLAASPELRRLVVRPGDADAFHLANGRLRRLYDGIVDALCATVGDVGSASFLDVGCNAGYFPLSFRLRGARWAGGCDRQDYAEAFALLNAILATDAEFIASRYDPLEHRLSGVEPADVVISMAVLCHLSDPLYHLARLGALARRALFVWTLVNPDDGYSIRFGEAGQHYPDDPFPVCFDDNVSLSMGLLRRSFELMGFRSIVELPEPGSELPRFGWRGIPLRGVLGVR
jgi:hypothetical protein